MKKIALAIGLAGGGAVGQAAWQGNVQAQASKTPPGWTQFQTPVPYRLTELSGDQPHQANAWSLDFKQEIRPSAELKGHHARLSGTVLLPQEGQIELWAAAPPIDPQTSKRESWPGGLVLILERIDEPSSNVYLTRSEGRTRLPCSDELEAPSDDWTTAVIEPTDAGVLVQVGESQAECSGSIGDFGPAVVPGLRRVSISDLQIGETSTPNPERLPQPIWWVAGMLLGLLTITLEIFTRARPSLVILTTTPLLGAAWLSGHNLQLWAETARVTWLPVPWLPALFPLWFAMGLKLMHHLGRSLIESTTTPSAKDWTRAAVVAAGLPAIYAWAIGTGGLSFAACIGIGIVGCGLMAYGVPWLMNWLGSLRPTRAATLLLTTGTLFSLVMASTIPNHRLSILLSGLGGMTFACLIWANANAPRARFYNLTCLVMLCTGVALSEGAIRYTKAGTMWSGKSGTIKEDDIYGWVQKANQDFECFDAGQYTDYPTECFPSRPELQDGRFRIVSMGGSSTAGAWQNDDIREFYPARLQEMLGSRAHVINQGVGGWTTFQIHQYLVDSMQTLEPDVLTFYIGHNDILTSVPLPYSELYKAWQGGSQKKLSEGLSGIRLYQGLRYLLTSMRPPQRRVAVPVEDAKAMLEEIIELMEKRGGSVILASEGLDPSPGPLTDYNNMLAGLAEAHANTRFVDTADRLHASDDDAFFDDCHLKPDGHMIVANALYEELESMDILSP